MAIEFSLEQIAGKIHSGKTREYFQEVLSSYQNENYRSSVVMLWSVVVCDIVYKLEHLVDLYEDAAARQILSELSEMQEKEPRSPVWELKLIELVSEKTQLIDGAEYENLLYLQRQRHLSAHPVLNRDRELHSPNKETVRSLLRNALEDILIKPPFYTQRVLTELLLDIEENAEVLSTREKVQQYVVSRYLNRLKVDVELQIFRSLWKLIFKSTDPSCENNRAINLKVLEVISKRHLGRLKGLISGENDYYSNIASGGQPVSYLVFYLSENPELYELLHPAAKLKVQHCISIDKVGKAFGWFIKNNLEQHFNDLLAWIEGDDHPSFKKGLWDHLLTISDSPEWQTMFCKLVGAYYAASRDYDEADARFEVSLEPRLHLFSLDDLTFTLERIENNNQTYGREQALQDHPRLKGRVLELDENFDCEAYPSFAKSAKED